MVGRWRTGDLLFFARGLAVVGVLPVLPRDGLAVVLVVPVALRVALVGEADVFCVVPRPVCGDFDELVAGVLDWREDAR